MASNRARDGGFSLLELIIVLMVMISLLAIVWPSLQRPLGRTSLSEAAQTLRSAIDDSRYLAITTGTPMFVGLRQGDGVLRAGSFDSFVNTESDLTASLSSSLQPSNVKQPNDGSVQAATQSALRTWKLPESVVVSDVRWTLEPPADEFGDEVSQSASGSVAPIAEVQSESMFEMGSGKLNNRDGGASRHTWWLPLVATGRGRDAAIVLLDTSINEEITVTFASATGALEIVR